MRATLNFIAAMALTVGCRGVPQPSVAPHSFEVTVGQLRFVSDFQLPQDHRLVRELAAERQEVCQTLGLHSTNEPIVVYLFSDGQQYRHFLSRYFPGVPSRRAFFLETDTSLSVYAQWSDRVAEDLRHEVAHGYLHAAAPGLPLWLDEGLAEFFEVPRGQDGMNRPHLELLSDMMQHENWQPSLSKLEQLTEAAQMEQIHYAEAWAWVYFLLHSGPEQRELLTDYLSEVSLHGRAEPLSSRMASLGSQPEGMVVDYLVHLEQQQNRLSRTPRALAK